MYGDLGVGKTAFVQGLAKGLGIDEPITSPTFTIVNEYSGRLPLYHFDVYRIADSDEMYEIGYEEYVYGDGVSVIEWPQLIDDILPEKDMTLLYQRITAVTIITENRNSKRRQKNESSCNRYLVNVATVAVMEDELLLGEYILNHKKTHSQKIMTMIEQILSELELTVQNIDIFAAAIGPGSFTGLRIGVATVKALAHATGKPVVSVGTLEALAYNVPYAEHIIVPIMDARRDNVFTASYIWDEGFKEIGEPEAISIDECLESCGEFLDTIFVGDGVKVHREYIKEKLGDKAIFPPANALNSRASSVAALALDKAKRGETQSYLEMKPYYIRKSQAERELEEKENKEKGESK